MDAQELRNLQEAYMEVYELDENMGREPYDLNTGYSDRQKRIAQIRTNKPRSERIGRGHIPTTTDMGNERQLALDIQRAKADTPKSKRRLKHKVADYYGKGNKADRKEEFDIYDIILSHLLDEGYAETPEAAEAIMVNMSEEWREDIMERENSPYEKASDAALDARYGYGRASGDKRSFGRAANRSSAAAALRALRRGERSGSGTSTEAGADAVHRGWAKTAKTSADQTPEKKAKRATLANTEYKDLPDDEKEKDRVSFNAVKATYKNRNR